MIAADYLQQLAALLPTGPALPREPGSTLMRLLEPPAAELARIELRGLALLDEADPRATTEMLVDWERAFGLPDGCSPIDSFERASEATYFDGAGVLRTAAADTPRPAFDPLTGQPTGTIIIEPGATNEVPNARFEGGAAGTPGTMVTGMALSTGAVARVSLAKGTEDGIPYLEIELAGTTTVSSSNRLILIPAASRPAADTTEAADWTGSWYLSLSANPGGVVPTARVEIRGWDASTPVQTLVSATLPVGTGPLRVNRREFAALLTAAGIVSAEVTVLIVHAPATTYNYKVRVGGPQLERGSVATSLILPPPATIARSIRAPDIARTASFEERRDALLGRVTGLGGQSRAYFIAVAAALGYPITIAEPRPFRCGISTVGMGLRDQEWAHCWVVYSAGEAERLFRCGASAVGDPFQSWGEALLECVIGRLAPAHTRVLFAYGPGELLLTEEFEALSTDDGELLTP